jgi:hypothetical protein
MLEYLSAQIDKAEGPIYDDLITKYWWLHDRPEHPLRKVASNLERFIDAVKMGREIEGLTELLDQVDSILAESQVLPMCWMYLGKGGRGKIPVSRLVDQDYVLAPSLVCDVLSGIRLEVDKLLEALREEEWTMVQPPPETLGLAFPWDVATADVARELRAEWREQWANFFDGQYLDDKKKPIELSRMYQIIDSGGTVYLQDGSEVKLDGIKNMFGKWDEGIPKDEPQIRTQIAAHLARMIYRTRHNEAVRNDSGERRGFNDGLLWTKSIGLYYIQALKDAGLTAEYLPIKFDRYSQDLSDIDFEAKVYKGLVIRKSDVFEVGYVVGKLPKDGEYNVEGGLLVVQEAAPELLADATTINEEFDTPVEVE